jgi:hypothetical protein
MKLSFIFFFIAISCFAQHSIPFVDFNFYFRAFQDESFRVIELQRIQGYKAGDDFTAYIDNRGNLRVYDGQKISDVTNLNVNYQVSDYLMAWNVGPTVNLWDHGFQKTLTFNGRNYSVKDSIVVFEDLRYNSVNVYEKGKIKTLYTVVDELYMPVFIGENIVAFKDNGDFYKVYWNGQIYDLGVWNGDISFQGGTDILTFNDPTTRTFAVFDKGEFLDVESFYMKRFRAGRGFIVYEDLNGNLFHYQNGVKTQLSNFTSELWDVKDDIVIWSENSFIYSFSNKVKVNVCNYMPEDYLLKNNVFAFRNIMGGVSAFVDGKVIDISYQKDATYEIYGNSVIVQLFNSSFIVLKNGIKYNS